MADLFVSYSWSDMGFGRLLHARLTEQDRDVWMDWEDIRKAEDFVEAFIRGVDESDAIITIFSPDYLASQNCRAELERAIADNKRIIPLVYRRINFDDLPTKVRTLNAIFFCTAENVDLDDAAFESTFLELTNAIDTDLDYDRRHTRLLLRAQEWEREGKNTGFLLTGDEIGQAEEWMLGRQNQINPPTTLHAEYISLSRRHATRRLQQLLAGTIFALIMLLALSVLSFIGFRNAEINAVTATFAQGEAEFNAQTAVAEGNNRATQQIRAEVALATSQARGTAVVQELKFNESLRLASLANSILGDSTGNAETALLLGIRALNSAYSPQANEEVYRALDRLFTLQIFQGHTSIVDSLDMSTDGTRLLTGSRDGTARLWNIATGEELKRLSHLAPVLSVAISGDGRRAVTSSGSVAILWDLSAEPEARFLQGHRGFIWDVDISEDGRLVLTGGKDGTARLWDYETAEILQIFEAPALDPQFAPREIMSVAISPDGTQVLTGEGVNDQFARLWDANSGKELNRFQNYPELQDITTVQFSSDASIILTGSTGSTARTIQVNNEGRGNLFYVPRPGGNQVDTSFTTALSPDARYVLTGGNQDVARLWDVVYGTEIETFSGHVSSLTAAGFMPNSQHFLTASADNTVRLWNVDTRNNQRRYEITTTGGLGNNIALSSDGKFVLSRGEERKLRFRDLATGADVNVFSDEQEVRPSDFALSPDGTQALSVNEKIISLWDVQTGEIVQQFEDKAGLSSFSSVVISPDGKHFATSTYESTVQLWDVNQPDQPITVTDALDFRGPIVFSSDGQKLLTAENRSAVIRNIASMEILLTLERHDGDIITASFSPDGLRIITGADDNMARLWNAQTGELLHILMGHQEEVFSVSFSPNSKWVLTGSGTRFESEDNTARLWDVETGKERRVLYGHTSTVTDVLFSPDGKQVITASEDGTIRIWDSDYHDLIVYACTRVFRDFTQAERQRYSLDATPTCPQF